MSRRRIQQPLNEAAFRGAIIPSQAEEKSQLFNLPTGTASGLIMEVLTAGENVAELPERQNTFNRHSAIEVMQNRQQRRITRSGNNNSVTVELADIDKLTGTNLPAKKLFMLTLIKANEQALHNGELQRSYISFPLQELIDLGSYKTPQSARRGFNTGLDTLTSLKIKGKRRIGKKTADIEALEVLFTGGNIKTGQCTIYLNERINWGFITQYYTILPPYYFALNNRSSDLLLYIMNCARREIDKIRDNGYFTISFRAIQKQLMLPSENSEAGKKNPQRSIKEPIEEAVEAIETKHSDYFNNTEFSILPVYDETANIKDFLDKGYLKISLTGKFSQNFIEMSQHKTAHIEAKQKTKQRIQEKAAAIAQANKQTENTDE